MALKAYYEYMKPILLLLSDGKAYTNAQIRSAIAQQQNLSPEDLKQKLQSGKLAYNDRIAWALTYLVGADLVMRPRRGVCQITDNGMSFNQAHSTFTHKDLPITAKNRAYMKSRYSNNTQQKQENKVFTEESSQTPEAIIEEEFNKINQALAAELLDTLKKMDPYYFEQIVVDSIVAMGYGGSKQEIREVTQKTADGGIDGFINEDRLGLDVIYLQAKRWGDTKVGRPDVQNFAGALMGKQANKGIFITTSNFTHEAMEYVKTVSSKIILIDGQKLAEYMIELNVGVEPAQTYQIKTINNDYFESE
ncbi:MAG: restriction endonuclease [Alphaproteobacteria bacterium]